MNHFMYHLYAHIYIQSMIFIINVHIRHNTLKLRVLVRHGVVTSMVFNLVAIENGIF